MAVSSIEHATEGITRSVLLSDEVLQLSFSVCFNWGYPDYMREALRLLMMRYFGLEPSEYVCRHWGELRCLMEEADSEPIQYLVAGQPQTPQAVLDYLSIKGSARIARRVAENSRAHPVTLKRLSYHTDGEVRQAVAENPATPEAVLLFLCDDECPDVRYAMAENAAPAAVLDRLSRDDNPYVSARARQSAALAAARATGATVVPFSVGHRSRRRWQASATQAMSG